MTYPGFAQRLCLLSLAAAIATLCLLATTSEAEAQGRCRPGYQRTQKGCVRVACGANMVLRNGQCVCASGYVWQGKACVRQVVRRCGPKKGRARCICAGGYIWQGGACVARCQMRRLRGAAGQAMRLRAGLCTPRGHLRCSASVPPQ